MSQAFSLRALAGSGAFDGDSPVWDTARREWVPRTPGAAVLSGTTLPPAADHPHRLFVLLDEASAPPSGGGGYTGSSASPERYDAWVMGDHPPQVYMRMDTDLKDSSGNSRDFTVNGDVASGGGSLFPGGEGGSAVFNGGWLSRASGSWMNGPDNLNDGPFVDMIIQPSAVNGIRTIISRDGKTSGTRSWSFYIQDGELKMSYGDTIVGSTVPSEGGSTAGVAGKKVEAGKRYALTCYAVADEVFIFINGWNMGYGNHKIPPPGANFNSSNELLIGASYAGTSTPKNKFLGQMNRVAYYTPGGGPGPWWSFKAAAAGLTVAF